MNRKENLKIVKFLISKVMVLVPNYLPLQLFVSLFQFLIRLFNTFVISVIIIIFMNSWQLESKIGSLLLLFLINLIANSFLIYFEKKYELSKVIIYEEVVKEINTNLIESNFEDIENGELLNNSISALHPIKEMNIIDSFFSRIPNIINYSLSLISLLSVLLYLNIYLFILVIAALAINMYTNRKAVNMEKQLYSKSILLNREYSYYLNLLYNKSAIKEIHALDTNNFFKKRYHTIIKKVSGYSRKMTKTLSFNKLISAIANILILLFTYYIIYLDFRANKIGIEIISLLISSIISLTAIMSRLHSEVLGIGRDLNYLKEYMKYLEQIMANKEISRERNLLIDKIESIEFVNVCYSYDKQKNVLNDVSFKIDCSSVAIVGENGSGKTTIIKLILGLYKPKSGRILINGININKVHLGSLCSNISAVFQDYKILDYTVKENITFSLRTNKKDIENMLNEVNFRDNNHKNIDIAEMHLKSSFQTGGLIFSKGQNQKVCIARSLNKRGSLEIFDEPTASLDAITEQNIYNEMNRRGRDSIKVFISHRLKSCINCNKILFIKDGTIVDFANHQDLYTSSQEYRKLYNQQDKF